MYNLLVSYSPDSWNGPNYQNDLSRFGEHTNDDLSEKYKSLDSQACAELMRFPALFAFENVQNQPARVGWFTQIQKLGNQFRIKFEFDQSVPPIPAAKLLELRWDLSLTEWEMNRTHWALKDVDLISVLKDAEIIPFNFLSTLPPGSRFAVGTAPPSSLTINPTAFRVPAGAQVEPDLVSVMMPFNGNFNNVLAAVEMSCFEQNLRCQRADSIWDEDEIIQDVFSLIFRSRVVVCDFSNQNPNVFYEAGIAHTLGRPVIAITQHEGDVPFDLRHRRFVKYLNNEEGLTDLSRKLSRRLRTILSQ
jgi:hypothetical protein